MDFSLGRAVAGWPLLKVTVPVLLVSLAFNVAFYYLWRSSHEGHIKCQAEVTICQENFKALAGAGQINDERCEQLRRYYQNMPKPQNDIVVPPIDDNSVLEWLRGKTKDRSGTSGPSKNPPAGTPKN